jgi:hypothetical protein
MTERPTQTRTARYLATAKGKATLERKRQREQEKRKALTKVKRQHEGLRRQLTAARFETIGTSIQPTHPDDIVRSVCVQAGIPRWSESILNPAYVKRLSKQKPGSSIPVGNLSNIT